MRKALQTIRAGCQAFLEEARRRTPKRAASLGPAPRGAPRRSSEWIALGLLAAAGAVYAVVVALFLSEAYIDLGDGNYLYTSSRMADGLVIYRDFLSPQPPMHLLTGSLLVRLGRLWDNPLMTVRVFSIVLHLLTMGLVYLLGRRVTQSPFGGALAGAIYLALPIGFWWSLGFQSELLEMFFMLWALWLFLALEPRRMAGAGALMALAVLTNMTAAPYAVAAGVYLAVREPRRLLLWYALPLVGLWGGAAGYFEIRTGAFFENTITNQVGAFWGWDYTLGKLSHEGRKILKLEGGYILLALLGAVLYNRSDTRREREFLSWFSLALFLSFIYVAKGGTHDYIFSIGEPAVALFAAYFLHSFFYPTTHQRFFRESLWKDTTLFAQIGFFVLILLAVGFPGFWFVRNVVVHNVSIEQSADDVAKVGYYIRRYSEPGDAILSQPYYAFLFNRTIVEEYSELYLWRIKRHHELESRRPGEAVGKVTRIGEALERRKIPVVVANVSPANPEILSAPEMREPIEAMYKPLLEPDQVMKTLSFQLQIFIPKTDEELREEKKKTQVEKDGE